MLAPFLSVVIYGLLGTCSFFKLLVCVCLENVLLRDNPCISPQGCDEVVLKIFNERCLCEKFLLSKYLRFYLLEKRLFILVSFRQRYPTIKE